MAKDGSSLLTLGGLSAQTAPDGSRPIVGMIIGMIKAHPTENRMPRRATLEFLQTLTGPVVLVGHSYGGNIISMATTGNDQVQALVYLNGWMCDEGESQQQLLERVEDSLVGPAVRPVPLTGPDGSEGADLFLDPDAFGDAFAADVDPETAAVLAATQRPYAAAAFAAAPSGPPAWTTLPCWYLLGTQDKAIPPALQRFMAERANATIVEVPASHVSFLSQPEAATQLILQAVEAMAPARP
jgi:pimeloyl-ACP methyl ester carboxylesterase